MRVRCRRVLAAYFLCATLLVVLLSSLSSPPSPYSMEEKIRILRLRPTFIKENYTIKVEGSTANPIASQLSWVEDLSWKNPPVCQGKEPFILAMVISAVGNFQERERVRNTWARPKFYKYTGIRAIFVVGSSDNETIQDALDDESDRHQDIIENEFIDTYRNLTYKTVAWLSWVKTFCPNTPFIAKIDDDVLVNPFNLRVYLQRHLSRHPSSRFIHGRARFKAKPMQTSKWAVTKEEYPEKKYPPIVLGSAYIVDRNAVDILLAYVPYVPYLFLEDVFLTGLVAKKAGVKMKQAEKELYSRKFSKRIFQGTAAFLINPKPGAYDKAWRSILKYSKKMISKMEKGE